ncbi:MAG TPA: hypothetical protein PK715_11255 [Chitinophagales bacterium]|nr:hypothetical protein [Chitinophagales bacterium]
MPFIHAPHLLLLTSNLCPNKTHAVLLYGGSTLMGASEINFTSLQNTMQPKGVICSSIRQI